MNPKILLIKNKKRGTSRLLSCFEKLGWNDVMICPSIADGLKEAANFKPEVVFIQSGLLKSCNARSVRRYERLFQRPLVPVLSGKETKSLQTNELAAFDYIKASPSLREVELIVEATLSRVQLRKSRHLRSVSGPPTSDSDIALSETYRVSFKHHHAIQLLIDAENGDIVAANDAAEKYYGYSTDKFKTLKVWDLNAGDTEEVRQRLQEALNNENSCFQTTHRLASGELREVEIHIGKLAVDGRQLLYPVIHDITNRKRVEQEKDRLLANMKERIKELRCIHRVTKAVRSRKSLEQIFYKVLSHIPPAWQYPEITYCKLRFDGDEYLPQTFDETPWRLSSYIEVEGQIRGAIDVYYAEERPPAIEGPFLREERDLLNTIARTLGETIELHENSERIVKEKNVTQMLLDSLPGIFYLIDSRGAFLRWNKTYEHVSGYTPEEIADNMTIDFAHSDEWESNRALFEKASKGDLISTEANLVTKDGRKIRYLFTGCRVNIDGRNCVAGMGLDITAQKRTEAELRNLNAFLDSIIENIPHFIFLKDARDLRYIKCNRACEEFLEMSRDDLIGKTDYDVFPAVDAEYFVEDDKEVMATNQIHDLPDEMMHTKNKGVRFLHTRKIPILDEEGNPKYLLGISEDITERKRAEEKIRQYADIVENMQVGLYVYQLIDAEDDRSLQLTNANSAAEQLTGIPAEDLIGKKIDENFPNLRKTGIPKVFAEVVRTGHPRSFEDLNYSDDRISPAIFALKAFPMPNQSVGVVFENVTARKQVEEQLRKLSYAVEQSASVVIISDRQGRIEYVNPHFTEVTGYTADEVVGQNVVSLKSNDEPKAASKELSGRMKKGEEWKGELKGQHKNGYEYWVSVTVSPIRNKQDKIAHYVVIESDITELKRQEERLIESEEKYREFFEEDLTGDYIAAADGQIQFCNPAFVRMFGFESAQQALESSLLSLFPDEKEYEDLLKALKIKTKLDYYECQLLRCDGQALQVLQNITGLFDEHGELIQLRGYMFDDTRRKNLENQFRQAQKMEAIGTLAGGIAHDFNNILAAIIGFTELALDDVPAETRAGENLSAIFEAGLRARDLVRQILTFSRQTEHEFKPIRVDLIAREVVKFLRASLPPTIEVIERIQKDSGTIMADPAQLHQIIVNLSTNAYQAMSESGGQLTIALETVIPEGTVGDSTGGEYLRLSVCDTGSGMDEATLQRIFDPFFTTKKVGEGSGLGLSVVHGIVNSLNGYIKVDSTVGNGTTFHVYFPRLQEPEEAPPEQIAIPRTGNERVMLVDDEKLFLEMGKRLLERLGYQVVAISNSVEALQQFEKQPTQFDIVIADYIMPKMKGLDLAGHLLKIRSDVPIILITGYSEDLSKEKVKKTGIRDFLSKPIVAHQLSQALRNALNG